MGPTPWSPPRSIEVNVFRFTLLWFKDMATWPAGVVTLLAPCIKVYGTMVSGHAYVGFVRSLTIVFCILTFMLL